MKLYLPLRARLGHPGLKQFRFLLQSIFFVQTLAEIILDIIEY